MALGCIFVSGLGHRDRTVFPQSAFIALCLIFLVFYLAITVFWAGSAKASEKYRTSAHGHAADGVDRTGMPANYVTGNCAHCHEQHASINGSEPAPSKPGPSAYALFSDNFDTTKTLGPYVEEDNFCFYCHSGLGTYQQVLNYDFSRVFGGASTTGDITSILDAFNQTSYHNLKDIDNFAKDKFSWYKAGTNPCDACHNPHLAKDNASNPTDPEYSAISKPSNHAHLLGIASSERMSNYTDYIAPYASSSATREPATSGVGDGSDMPDYVGLLRRLPQHHQYHFQHHPGQKSDQNRLVIFRRQARRSCQEPISYPRTLFVRHSQQLCTLVHGLP